MKKLLLISIFLFSFLGFSKAALSETSVGWRCSINAELDGFEAGLIIAVGHLKGEGDLLCTSAEGLLIEKRIQMTIFSGGIGVGGGVISGVKIIGFNIGVENIDELLQQFSFSVSTGVTFMDQGIEPSAAIRVSGGGAGFELALMYKDVKGLGAYLKGNTLIIREI